MSFEIYKISTNVTQVSSFTLTDLEFITNESQVRCLHTGVVY